MNSVKSFLFAGIISIFVSPPSFSGDPKYAGDVVLRDLWWPVIQKFGHIGMYTGSQVIEVVDFNPAIQVNTLDSFKKTTPMAYYGAKYGKGFNFGGMIAEGLRQRSFGSSYSFFRSNTKPGNGGYVYTCYSWTVSRYGQYPRCNYSKYVYVTIPGVWRCDTFIAHIYQTATGQSIGEYSWPKNIFDSYPRFR